MRCCGLRRHREVCNEGTRSTPTFNEYPAVASGSPRPAPIRGRLDGRGRDGWTPGRGRRCLERRPEPAAEQAAAGGVLEHRPAGDVGARRESRRPSSGEGCSTWRSRGSTAGCRRHNKGPRSRRWRLATGTSSPFRPSRSTPWSAPVNRMIDAGIPVIDMDTLDRATRRDRGTHVSRSRQRIHGRRRHRRRSSTRSVEPGRSS